MMDNSELQKGRWRLFIPVKDNSSGKELSAAPPFQGGSAIPVASHGPFQGGSAIPVASHAALSKGKSLPKTVGAHEVHGVTTATVLKG